MGGRKFREINAQRAPKSKRHLHRDESQRKRLKKDPGLPSFGRFAPERFKVRQSYGPRPPTEVVGENGLAPATTLAGFAPVKKPIVNSVGASSSSSSSSATSKVSMATLMLNASKAADEFEFRKNVGAAGEDEGGRGETGESSNKASSTDHQAPNCRNFYREFRKVVEASDVLVEVLDARDPMGCRCLDLERAIKSEFHERKRFVLLLNKVDLVPREVAEAWLSVLRVEFPVVAFTSLRSPVGRRCVNCMSRVLNSMAVIEGTRRKLTVGVIGYPNVGKSSVINALKRHVVVAVGNTPGFTRVATEIQLNSHVTVMDCPGIVFSSAQNNTTDIALRNAIKIETLDDPVAPVAAILRRVDVNVLKKLYNLASWTDPMDFLTQVGVRKGKIGKRCEVLTDEAAKLVLKDWNDGRIPYYTMPDPELVAKAQAAEDSADNSGSTNLPNEFQTRTETLILQGLSPLDPSIQPSSSKSKSAVKKFGTAELPERRKRKRPALVSKKSKSKSKSTEEESQDEDEESGDESMAESGDDDGEEMEDSDEDATSDDDDEEEGEGSEGEVASDDDEDKKEDGEEDQGSEGSNEEGEEDSDGADDEEQGEEQEEEEEGCDVDADKID